MSNPRFSKSAIAVATALSFSVVAEQKNNDDEIERIAVWSTEIKASSMYLKGEEIASKQADHLSDLLRSIPGVDVGGAHSLNQRITIRSMDDKDLNIAIDGAAQNSYMYHHMGNLQIHTDILKSVDIEIGTNSVINGGLGGAVRFETKQARELLAEGQSIGGRVQFTTGENSGSNYSITSYGLLSENIDFLAYFNEVYRDNYEVGGGKILDADGNLVAGTDGKVRGLKGDLSDSLIKLGWNIDNNQRLSFGYESYVDEGNYSYRPDMGLATDLAITNSLNVPLLWPTEFTRDTATLNYDLNWGESSQLKATVYSNTSELKRDETGWAENPAFAAWASVVTGEAKNSGFNLLAESSFDGVFGHSITHDLTYGLDRVKHETYYHAQAASTAQTSTEEVTSNALFIQDRIDLGSGLSVTPGVRFESYDINSAVVDNSFSETSLAIAAEYQVNDNLLFKLSSTEIFKGPEISEVFVGAGLNDRLNQNIAAETGENTEFAIAYQTELSANGTISAGATLFRTNIDNYIYQYAAVPGGGPRDYWNDNIGNMEIDGYEAYLGYNNGKFNGQLTFASAESELDAFADYSSLHKARLDRQQGDTLSADLQYEIPSLDLNLNWEMMHVKDVAAAPDLDGASLNNAKDGFSIHNVSANWKPETVQGLTVIVGVDNLFDEFYASQSSRTGSSFHPRFGKLYLLDYEPGRNIKATISYQF